MAERPSTSWSNADPLVIDERKQANDGLSGLVPARLFLATFRVPSMPTLMPKLKFGQAWIGNEGDIYRFSGG